MAGYTANAQESKHKFFNDWSLELGLNNYILRGDVNGLHGIEHLDAKGNDIDYLNENKFDLGFGVRLAKQLAPAFDLGVEYNGMGFKALGVHKTDQVRSVDVDFKNVTLNSRISLTRLAEHRGKQPKVNVFAEAGLGMVWANQTIYNNATSDIDRNGTERLAEAERIFTIPAGLGAEFKIANRLSLGLKSKVYFFRYDGLDGIKEGTTSDLLIQNSLFLNIDLASRKAGSKGHKWNNSFADMSAGIVSNKENIDKLGNRINSLDDRMNKVESALANKVDKKAWKDTDGDGVHNDDDREPNTPKGELVNFQGISLSKVVGKGNNNAFFTPVYFNLGKHYVNKDQYVAVANMALYLQEHTSKNVKLIGYTDKTGSTSFNEKLAKKRTESVKNILIKKFGIDASRISIESRGENDLKSKLDRINRRVDFVLN